jgi:hypothetical protein
MKTIKLSHPYPKWPVVRQTPESIGIWGDYQFLINQDVAECDYWVIFGGLLKKEQVLCAPQNVVFLTVEPESIAQYLPRFLQQFAHVITCQRSIVHPSITYRHQGHPWFVGKTYDELMATTEIPKTKKISVITSNKTMNDGHKKRLEFCFKLKEYFGDQVDLFGRGIQDFTDKWDVLAPYEYSIAIENDVVPHWMTEKLYDCFLAHTFPIYHGCPNVADYFDASAYQRIDIHDFENSRMTIEKILSDKTHYQAHLPAIKTAKKQYLEHYNLFPLVTEWIESKRLSTHVHKTVVTLQPETHFWPIKTRMHWWASQAKSALIG